MASLLKRAASCVSFGRPDEAALLSGEAFRDIVATHMDLRELELSCFLERAG
jgi:hypothetical protein